MVNLGRFGSKKALMLSAIKARTFFGGCDRVVGGGQLTIQAYLWDPMGNKFFESQFLFVAEGA